MIKKKTAAEASVGNQSLKLASMNTNVYMHNYKRNNTNDQSRDRSAAILPAIGFPVPSFPGFPSGS